MQNFYTTYRPEFSQLETWRPALPHESLMIYKTKKQAIDALNSEPFTLACRARHEIVPVYARNLLGEKIHDKPIGYGYRLKKGI